jgi:hypothetical protein
MDHVELIRKLNQIPKYLSFYIFLEQFRATVAAPLEEGKEVNTFLEKE